MIIKVQLDSEIAEHIVNKVTPDTLKQEEKLALKHKGYTRRSKSVRFIDAGLTVSKDQTDNPMDTDHGEDMSEGLSHHKIVHEEEDEEDKDVSGRSMFGFQSKRKRASSMMQKAAEVQNESQTPVEENKEETSSRKSGRRVKPTMKRKQLEEEYSASTKSDFSKKRRIQRQLELLKDDQKSSDEGQSSSDEEEDEEVKSKERGGDTTEGYERYFLDLHGKAQTSNNTLSKLQVLEPHEFHLILQKTQKKHRSEMHTLFEMQKQHFSQWYFELHSGFNLIFYGYGSKRNLLNEFAQTALTNGPLVVINGFFPSISIKDILLKITAGALGVQVPTGQIQDHVAYICNYFSREDREYDSLYIVIHNLDGPNLRNERTQTALSMLASANNIHLVVSVDHINAGLLWDNVKSSRFNWIWHDATTFDDYLVETSFENSLLIRSSELGGARGAKYVLDSLTTNARGVFKILAEHQLMEMEIANMDGKGNESVGLSYGQYYQKCREGFFVSSDLALRTELTEFRDHKLISSKKAMDGTELFFIPLDKSTLLHILEQM
ncbi:ORC2-domain-containing protein [Rhizopus microsporus var. microsporus]|nr:ORC2-domain-containing protein [Rhizopus microsporus var. microsporus]